MTGFGRGKGKKFNVATRRRLLERYGSLKSLDDCWDFVRSLRWVFGFAFLLAALETCAGLLGLHGPGSIKSAFGTFGFGSTIFFRLARELVILEDVGRFRLGLVWPMILRIG